MGIVSSVICLFGGNVAALESPFDILMPGAMGSFRRRRWNSALPVVDVTSLSELLGARQRLDQ